jgi:hypothetical protein
MDIYAIVTDKIINLLQQGVVPWRRPWTSAGLPRNLVSKKPFLALADVSAQIVSLDTAESDAIIRRVKMSITTMTQPAR